MKLNNRTGKIIGAGVIAFLVISTFTSMAFETSEEKIESPLPVQRESLPYEARLIIYVAEPESRWDMYNGQPYHYAALDYAFNDDISIDYLDTYQDTIVWEGDVLEDNAIVFAAVFNTEWYQGYAYPPSSNPFDAHYNDAAAGATPGTTDYNQVTENFTHTVFLEEGTATWCQFCPDMANALYSIYQSGDYPYYFVALVEDKFPGGAQRLRNEYNIYGYPTAFFDGGRKVYVGGNPSETPYRQRIEQCGEADVHELNLTLSVAWLGGGDLQIDISITNYEESFAPETPSTPDGPTIGNVGIEYTYTTNTTDPDGGDLFYLFDWGDGSDSGWIGPLESGETAEASQRWEEQGDFEVKVKAKDRGDHETDWSDPLSVQMAPAEFILGVKGGLSFITATIENNGEVAYPDVNWSIASTGGILGGIDVFTEGGIGILGAGEIESVQTDKSIFGLGRIDITVTAETTVMETTGFVIGPFILILG